MQTQALTSTATSTRKKSLPTSPINHLSLHKSEHNGHTHHTTRQWHVAATARGHAETHQLLGPNGTSHSAAHIQSMAASVITMLSQSASAFHHARLLCLAARGQARCSRPCTSAPVRVCATGPQRQRGCMCACVCLCVRGVPQGGARWAPLVPLAWAGWLCRCQGWRGSSGLPVCCVSVCCMPMCLESCVRCC